MSVMAYGLRSGPDDRRLALQDVNFSRPMLTREIMVKNGDAAKPIWASEMGWNVQPESVTDEPIFGRVTEELQARYTVRGLQRAAEEWPWMGVMNLWFFKRADDRELEQPFYYFRMVDPDFTPRPVYGAIKAMATKPPVLNKGHAWADDRALTYGGNWKQGPPANPGPVLAYHGRRGKHDKARIQGKRPDSGGAARKRARLRQRLDRRQDGDGQSPGARHHRQAFRGSEGRP